MRAEKKYTAQKDYGKQRQNQLKQVGITFSQAIGVIFTSCRAELECVYEK